ncbi:hypothetical protein [Kitasatospora sp. NPDC059571]|uniref:hypothetical protein n=1 Tax=Kitasatospora sp. NPDC059571 TaxID=3346871 RepID=UPI0036AAF0AB
MSVTDAPQPSRAAAPDVRLVRSVAFATVSTALAAAAHTAAGGPVGLRAIVAGWVLVWSAAALGAGRERALGAITGALVLSQLGLHLFFQACHVLLAPVPGNPSAAAGGMAGMPEMAGMTGHLHGGHAPVADAAGTAVRTAAHAGLVGLSPGMLASHAAAALVTGWLLHRVEAALWRLMGLARTVRAVARRWRARVADTLAGLVGRRTVPAARPARTRRPPLALPHRLRPVLLRHSVIRRGPPGAVYA